MRALFLFFPLVLSALTVDLKSARFQDGVLVTTQGGVVRDEDVRIQARNIQYFHRLENGKMVQRIEADGDLMVQYKGKIFVGSSLEYDFEKRKGVVYDGKTCSSCWYIGGDAIYLEQDGTAIIERAFITTCENKESSWDITAATIDVVPDQYLKATGVRFRFIKPLSLWIPSFRVNLQKFKKEPVLKYYLNWNKGPKAGLRYQIYSWQDLALYGRLEYRWEKGWGGAFETEYYPENKKLSFVTRSYAGTDRLFNAVDAEFRYRVQGALYNTSDDERTKTALTWDKYSDVRMPGDFATEDFEVNTAMKTLFYVNHRGDDALGFLKARPRLNPFESIKQDLPTLYVATRPTAFAGNINEFYLKASYLAFDYSSQLTEQIPDYQSPRVEIYDKISRPLKFHGLHVAPYLAGRAIFYGTTPEHEPRYLALLDYGLEAHLKGRKGANTIEPYLKYKALSRPTVSPASHYIFSIADGYEKLQEVSIGTRHLQPDFSMDIFANAFFSEIYIPQVFPRGYLNMEWRGEKFRFLNDYCYNFRNHVIDYVKGRLLWTVNEDVAMSLEGRWRSKYDWRKADHENFVVDVSRSEESLLDSPLSDQRVALLSNIFIRLNPFWELQWESHHGFCRFYKNSIKERPYNEFKIHLYTWLTSAWKLHFYYGYTLNNHFDWTVSIKLVKKNF